MNLNRIKAKRIASVSSLHNRYSNKNNDDMDKEILISNNTKEKVKILQEIAMVTIGSISQNDDNSDPIVTIPTKGYITDDDDRSIDSVDYNIQSPTTVGITENVINHIKDGKHEHDLNEFDEMIETVEGTTKTNS